MEIRTIGFTKNSAASFFGRLKAAGVTRLIDVRLNNTGQLSGFAKRDDLQWFLKELCGAEYIHAALLAPTQDLLDSYKKQGGRWETYERQFLGLMATRQIEKTLDPTILDGVPVLLCSEHTAEHCHRRLVIEYLAQHWNGVQAIHL